MNKKVFFSIILLIFLFSYNLNSRNFFVIKGLVIDKQENFFKIKSFRGEKVLEFKIDNNENFKDVKTGDFIKIFTDHNGNIIKIKKLNITKIRERIKRIREFMRGRSHLGGRGHRGRR